MAPKTVAWVVTYGAAIAVSTITTSVCRLVPIFYKYIKNKIEGPVPKKPEDEIDYGWEYTAYRVSTSITLNALSRLIGSVFVFLAYGLIVAFIFKAASGYPYFVFYRYPKT
jgi:hypothetical protein